MLWLREVVRGEEEFEGRFGDVFLTEGVWGTVVVEDVGIELSF